MDANEQLKLINEICQQRSIDLSIRQGFEGRYHWNFRAVDSRGYKEGRNGFETPLEALLHFTEDMIKAFDCPEDIEGRVGDRPI